jgi:hypothetical protein
LSCRSNDCFHQILYTRNIFFDLYWPTICPAAPGFPLFVDQSRMKVPELAKLNKGSYRIKSTFRTSHQACLSPLRNVHSPTYKFYLRAVVNFYLQYKQLL